MKISRYNLSIVLGTAKASRLTSLVALLSLLLFTSHAFASVGAWSYAGNNYPTQAPALAAMHAVSATSAREPLITVAK